MSEQERGPGPAAEWFRRCPACGGIGEQYHPTTGGFGEPLYAPTPCPAHCERGFVPAADPDRAELRERAARAAYAVDTDQHWTWDEASDYEREAMERIADAILVLIPPGDGLAGLLRRAGERALVVTMTPAQGDSQWVAVVGACRPRGRDFWGEGDSPEAALSAAMARAEGNG